MDETYLILLIFGIAASALFFFFRFRQKQREAELAQAGRLIGMIFVAGDNPHIRARLVTSDLFTRGTSPRLAGRLEGAYEGTQFSILDYLHGNIANNVTNRYLVSLFHGDCCGAGAKLREKTSRERLVHGGRAASAMEVPAGYEILRDAYVLQGSPDYQFSERVLASIEELANTGRRLSIECGDGFLLIYRPVLGRLLSEDVRIFAEDSMRIENFICQSR